MVKVAIYTRVSTEDQATEGYSLPAQLERLKAYCESQDWTIFKVYEDDGYSGRNTKRPGYSQMLKDRDSWDMILVLKMDRIHRNSRNFMEMMDNLRKLGKEFSSMQESLDTSTAMGRFVVDIIQRIAQLESEQIGERVYAGMKQKAKTVGGPLGGNIPYGYKYNNGEYKLNKDECEVVRMIFSKYFLGCSSREIADSLNSIGIHQRNRKNWNRREISKILKNPIYCGFKYWDGILDKGDHPKIIKTSIFNDVQVRILERAKNIPQEFETLLP
ncbi:MAG: recombinase family protein, partial [Candidatus Thorarchaeota archaeon]